MNLGIYRSWHSLGAAALAGGLLAWHLLQPMPFGSRDDANVVYLLTTGWVAVACYVVLALYAVRRAAHRLRLSPEFAWKAKLPQLERAQSKLRELQNRVDRRELAGAAAVRAAAAEILRGEGVQRVLRVDVTPDPRALGLVRLFTAPREPLGRLASWLHAHVFYGLAAAAIVWFHGGARCGSTMGLLLNGLSAFVIGSGMLGALLWTFGPGWLTRAERELSIEKTLALRDHYDRKIEQAEQELANATGADDARLCVEIATLQGQRQRIRREARRLGRYRLLLRGWRLLHVPASVLLLALVAVHVISIYYY
jgi:hypothetical protein